MIWWPKVTKSLKVSTNAIDKAIHILGGFFKNLTTSKEDRMDEARELYAQAANCYKLAKDWNRAAEANMRCVSCSTLTDNSDIANYYLEAANCIKNVNTN